MSTASFMMPFTDRFPDLGLDDQREIECKPGSPVLPFGTFAFAEHFCADPGCDCRRVLVEVRSEDEPHECYAAIIWGWEWADYYEPWTRDRYAAELYVAGYLDPTRDQSEHAEDFLALFRHLVSNESAGWAEQFAEHYDMFKATFGLPPPGSVGQVRCIRPGRENYPLDDYDGWLRNS